MGHYPPPGGDSGPLNLVDDVTFPTCPLLISPTQKDPNVGCMVMYSPQGNFLSYHYVQLGRELPLTVTQCWRVTNQYVAAVGVGSNPCGGSDGIYGVLLFSLQQMMDEGPAVAPGATGIADAVVHSPTFTVQFPSVETQSEDDIIAVATNGNFLYVIEQPTGSTATYTIHRISLTERIEVGTVTLSALPTGTIKFARVVDKDGFIWASSETSVTGNYNYKAHKINPADGTTISVAVGSNRTDDGTSSLTAPVIMQTGGAVIARIGESDVDHLTGTHYYGVNSACDTVVSAENDTTDAYNMWDNLCGWDDTLYRLRVEFVSGLPEISIASLKRNADDTWTYATLVDAEDQTDVHTQGFFTAANFASNFTLFMVTRLLKADGSTLETSTVKDANGLQLLDSKVPKSTSNFGIVCNDPSYAWTGSIGGATEIATA